MNDVPTNFQRATWAKHALVAFVEATGGATAARMNPQGLNDDICDLICDLLHLANQCGFHPECIVAQAQANYDAELWEVLQ